MEKKTDKKGVLDEEVVTPVKQSPAWRTSPMAFKAYKGFDRVAAAEKGLLELETAMCDSVVKFFYLPEAGFTKKHLRLI